MDEFGLLTERFGLKPQGKAAPMASSKRSTNVGGSQTGTFGVNSGLNAKPYNYGSKSPAGNSNFHYDSFHNNHNGTFQSSGKKKTQNFGGLGNGFDIFNEINKPASHLNVGNGGMFDYDSIFSGSNKSVSASSSSHAYVDDIFGGMPESKIDDVFPVFVSPPKQSVPVDDLLDKMDGLGVKSKSTNMKGPEGFAKRAADFEELVPGFGKSSDFDELIPAFGKSSSLNNRRATTEMNKPHKSTVASHDDPILIFETASSRVSSESFPDPLEQISKFSNSRGAGGNSKNTPPLKSHPKPATRVSTSNNIHDSVVSSIDELEDFAMGQVHNASKRSNIHTGETAQKSATNTNSSKEAPNSAPANQSNGIDDLESFFGMGSRSSSVPKSRTTTSDHIFDGQMQHKARHEAPQRASSRSSASVNKSSMMTSFDDLSLIFDEASNSSVFQEVEGETEERRKARLGRYQRTQERAARAVADMNQRDLQTKMEQDERRRIAEIVDVEIKRWAAGKEGNMRALLSTLQHVLWPECGWQPVSLTDMITSGSVKKVYRKATLFVHPDKVQQKGASLKEKYTAEKVFDILKEAWNKFNAEELS